MANVTPEEWLSYQTVDVTASVAAGAANIALVTLTFKDMVGRTQKKARPYLVYLSDSAVGDGLTATTASGAVAAGASGTDLGDLTSKKAKMIACTASGIYILSITDTSKTAFKVCVDFLNGHGPVVAATLATASYG